MSHMSNTKEIGVVLPPTGARVAARLPTLPARGKLYAVATRKLGHKAVAVAVEWATAAVMIVETAERVGPGPGQLRDRCCRAVGEMVVQALWRGQLHFQPAIYIPEPVERTVREWVECVPTCLRYKHRHKLTAPSCHVLCISPGRTY